MPLHLPTLGDGSPVVLTELGGANRSLVFAGKDRPEPVTRTTTMRTTQTWYPGARQASTQVLGIREEPISLTGWWRDPLSMLDGGPQARMSVLRGIQDGQRLCRLQWGDALVLYGRVARLSFQMQLLKKVRYEFDFEIDSSDEPISPRGVAGLIPVAGDVAEQLGMVRAHLRTAADIVRTGSALGAFVPGG